MNRSQRLTDTNLECIGKLLNDGPIRSREDLNDSLAMFLIVLQLRKIVGEDKT